jgi:hypothetical protein
MANKLAHVSELVKAKYQEYHQKFGGRVMLSRLLQLGNIGIDKLPVIPELMDGATGKNNLCYNHCLGACPHGDNCYYKKLGGHVDGNKLPTPFVQNLCQVIEPGITEAMKLSSNRPATVGSGPAIKKARH